MTTAHDQHMAWMARSFGRPDYLPLDPSDLELLRGVSGMVKHRAGGHLFREGEPARAAFLLERGEVELYRSPSHRPRVISRMGPGSVLGDIAMFEGREYMSSARATDDVTAISFPRDELLPELARHPALCLRWLVAGLRQLELTQSRILHLMHKTVLGQVADLLLEESRRRGGEVGLSQEAIATLLGSSRQSVNQAVRRLRELGAVVTGYRRITIVDAATLGRVAREDQSAS
ncbi:MAG TPA: Crp/Fnr family transcriptional regulator [Acidimicrobiia bacterium]|nr:Crp/Fnr family transcriptional regulator [Acidimicrobiia bacterium]